LLLLLRRWRRRRTLRWSFRRLSSWSRGGPCRRLLCPRSRAFCRCRSRCWLLTRSCRGAICRALSRRRPICWLFIRVCHWAIRRTLIWCGPIRRLFVRPRSGLFVRTCHRPIRWTVGRAIIRLCVWRTVSGSRRPRVRLRLRVVRLSHGTISWSIRRLRRIWLRHRSVRRPVVRLYRVWLRHRPTFNRSISRLFVIRRSRSIRRIVLWLPWLHLPRLSRPIPRVVLWLPWLRLPRLTRTICNVALRALSRCAVHGLSRLWSFSHRYRSLLWRWSDLYRRRLSLYRRRGLDLPNLSHGKRLTAVALDCFLAFFK
jgi:hypothetical protein